MPGPKRLIFAVTNDLVYDQRMIRICTSLATAGHDVLLVGRRYKNASPLIHRPFRQKRLFCFFRKGKGFYLEYNLRLFFFLLFQKAHLLCAIDLDTSLPVWTVAVLKGSKKVYDAHELFCEMKEVVSRPAIYKIWKWIERKTVPRFPLGYTVNEPIRDLLQKEYGVHYEVIRNVPLLQEDKSQDQGQPFILYQGAVNQGRSFETLIPAFQRIDLPLHIYGDGNYLAQAKAMVKQLGLEEKVIFKGKLPPGELRKITGSAILGITLFENKGLSNYYSLANRFFDYMHACIPQLCVDYPAYREINHQFEVALLIRDLSPKAIAQSINRLLHDPQHMQRMRNHCQEARKVFNWQAEEKKLLQFYQNIFA